MAKEEWQDPDSGYLNCIGVGDTYVKKADRKDFKSEQING